MPAERLLTLLRALSSDAYVSGSALAERLMLSRASVHLALQSAESCGVAVERLPGRGYRLFEPISWLDPQAVGSALESPWTIEVVDVATSTNTLLMERKSVETAAPMPAAPMPAAPAPVCLAAELQTAGRGRRGRPWQGCVGGSLLFSVAWPFAVDVTHLSGLSLVVGLAVAQGLERYGVPRVRLKWPNDLLVDFRKLAGILVEVQAEADSPCRAIIGIGVNVRLPEAVRRDIDQAVVDLAQLMDGPVDRNRLLAAILDALALWLPRFAEQGFAACREEWEARHAYHRQAVNLIRPSGESIQGRVAGIGDTGELRLERGGKLESFTVGELSLRRVSA